MIVDMQQTVNIPFQKDKELFKSIEDRYFKDRMTKMVCITMSS